MNLKSLWRQFSLATRFALRHPWRVLATPLPAIAINLWVLWFRVRGFRILLWYVDHSEYLPFVRPVWERLPNGLGENVKLVLVARPETKAVVAAATQRWSPKPSRVTTSWIGSLIAVYDLFLTTHPTAIVPLRRSGPRICTFHGLPAKGGAFSPDQWRFLDGAFLLGPLHRNLFEELRESSPEFHRLKGWEIGYPKSDSIVLQSYDRSEIARNLNLPFSRSLLFAPTWEEHGILRSDGISIIQELCEWGENTGVNILVKLHPMSSYPASNTLATGGVDWRAALSEFNKHRCFRHLKNSDLSVPLALADVLLSDFSSATLEAILADIPIVLLDTPRLIDEVFPRLHGIVPHDARHDPRHNCGRDAATVLSDRSQMIETLQRELDEPESHAEKRAMIRARLLFNRGNASQAAVEFILAHLGKDQIESPQCALGSPARLKNHETERCQGADSHDLVAD